MKKLIYSIAIITLLSTLTSCTADEIEPVKKPDTTTSFSKDGQIDPPPPIPTIPK